MHFQMQWASRDGTVGQDRWMDSVKFVLCLNWLQDTWGKNLLAHSSSSASPKNIIYYQHKLWMKNIMTHPTVSLIHTQTHTDFQVDLQTFLKNTSMRRWTWDVSHGLLVIFKKSPKFDRVLKLEWFGLCLMGLIFHSTLSSWGIFLNPDIRKSVKTAFLHSTAFSHVLIGHQSTGAMISPERILSEAEALS